MGKVEKGGEGLGPWLERRCGMGEGGLEEKEGMVRMGEGEMMDMYAEGGVRFWGNVPVISIIHF